LKISFKTTRLQKEYEDQRKAVKSYGEPIARKYIQRVNLLKQARDLDEVKTLPGLDCHPLKGDRKGQWAVKLSGFYRLIFTVSGNALNLARIEEVSKHYDD
jgi:proteic killer suppression protein